MNKVYTTEFAGKKLTIETGKMAQFANGAVLVKHGDTAILSTALAAKNTKKGLDFFPLSVDFDERDYAFGKIPGGNGKREGKPSDESILIARAIDRPIRPLFPKDFRNEVQISNILMSKDKDCSSLITAMMGTSAALSISDIPFNGPIASVEVGLVDGKIILNPDKNQLKRSDLHLTLAGTKDRIAMIEAGANEISEDIMMKAIDAGQKEINKLVDFLENIRKDIGKEKFSYEPVIVQEDLYNSIKKNFTNKMKSAIITTDKQEREYNLSKLDKEISNFVSANFPEHKEQSKEALTKLEKEVLRNYTLNEHKRIDGRNIDEIRPLNAEVSVLPRTHGSGLFSRGQTQVLTTVTLDAIDSGRNHHYTNDKQYVHHYNFPGFATGEIKPNRGPGRREIGHGYLAQKALEPVIPTTKDFPYSIRAFSETLMSNGSSSQASIVGSTLALMDAGVPIKAPVAGIAAGLITDSKNPDKFVTLMDLQGLEDAMGDMDFKVAGTKKGITAIQMDTKINGLSREMIIEALKMTKKGREQIIDNVILPTIPEPIKELSPYAPKASTLIVEPGKMYLGRVTKIIPIGAFVELEDSAGRASGKSGLVKLSELSNEVIKKPEDVVKVGDQIRVKVLNIDEKGRINLSKKAASLGLLKLSDSIHTYESQLPRNKAYERFIPKMYETAHSGKDMAI
jgi:polyribonucleotide nucleotidyltransferase